MVKWIEGALEKHRAKKTILFFIIVYFAALAISIVSKIFNECNNIKFFNFLNRFDTFFSVIVGFLTVVGLVLAFIAIKGFFERIRDFKDLLESIEELIRDVPPNTTINIMGYYLTFGVVTLGHTKIFKQYISALFNAMHPDGKRSLHVLIEDPKERQNSLTSYCKKYGFDNRALKYIFDDISRQDRNINLKNIIKDIDIDNIISHKKEKGAAEFAAFIFNVFNELLIIGIPARTRFLAHIMMPDYHVIFSSQSPGIIFVPLKIPQAKMEKIGDNAEIIGWRSVDPELIRRLDKNFEYYWSIANERNEPDVISEFTTIKKEILKKFKT